jgi:hypothetical protein
VPKKENEMMPHHKTRDLTFGAALGLALGLGCPYDDTDHCSVEDGDAYCARKYAGAAKPYCAIGHGTCQEKYPTDARDGCVEARPVEGECYSPCGDGKSMQDDLSCDGQAETSSTSVSASGTDPTTSPTGDPTTQGTGSMSNSGTQTEGASTSTAPAGCVASIECTDAENPICLDTECVPCSSDEQCGDRDVGKPACRDDGHCVACTPSNASACVDTTPVCNAGTNACEGCTFHEQCEGTACEIATGACFAEDCVVEVDGDGGSDYDNIQDAIVDGCVVIVHAAAGGYAEEVSIDGAITVAVLAADGEVPLVGGVDGSGGAVLEVSGGAAAYVQGLRVNGNDMGGVGVAVNAATLYLDRTAAIGNTGGGMVLTNNALGDLRNCTLGGSGAADVAAATVTGSSFNALYTTMVGYDDGGGGGAALRCTNPDSVVVRNSILVKTFGQPEIECDDALISYSGVESAFAGAGNVQLGNMVPSWFDADLHLNMPPAAVLTTAQWQPGHPSVDIDGDARPDEPGAMDVAGADVP